MELCEAVAVIIATENHDEDCYFCNSKDEPVTEENDLEDSYPEDEDLEGIEPDGIKFKNDASKLGKALGGKPNAKQITLTNEPYKVSVAAHHLIPGNASLKKSELFESKEYLWTDGEAKGNIGYNINSSPNGVWLPGNYAQRPWGTDGAAFKTKTGNEPVEYAFAAIEAWRSQFHDAHKNYSKFVTTVLDKIYDKLEATEEIWCPEAKQKEKKPEERSPLYVLVNRLNTVSARMKRMLVFPTANWKKNIWTSRFSLEYMNKK